MTALALPDGAGAAPIDKPQSVSAVVLVVFACATAAMADTLNATFGAVTRNQVMGQLGASVDEVAWITIAYLAAKLAFFPIGAWAAVRFGPYRTMVWALSSLGAASLLGAMTTDLGLSILARALQGAAGGSTVVIAQTALFWLLPMSRQGMVQACYAISVVLGTATLAPGVHGWVADTWQAGSVLYLSTAVSMIALLAVVAARRHMPSSNGNRPFDWIGAAAFAVSMLGFVVVAIEGARFDWFADSHIIGWLIVAVAGLVAFLLLQIRRPQTALIDASPFADPMFTLCFGISFFAGFALFGSGLVIPGFAQQALGWTATYAGGLLMPSAASLFATLMVAGYLIRYRGLKAPMLTPFGILFMIAGMLWLSYATPDSTFVELALPLVVRSIGLGCLFLGLTFEALEHLRGRDLAAGIGLFNMGRQLGGLIGLAFTQTYLLRQSAEATAQLAPYMSPGDRRFVEAQEMIISEFIARGLTPTEALTSATSLMQQEFSQQVATLAYIDGIMVFVWLFPLSAPIIGMMAFANFKVRKASAPPAPLHAKIGA